MQEVTGSDAGPIRQCVGCRERAAAVELLRVVARDGNIVPDPRRRLSGRGAWVHPRLDCLMLAERRRAFGRALRAPTITDSSAVRQYLDTFSEVAGAGPGTELHAGDGAPTSQKAGQTIVSMP